MFLARVRFGFLRCGIAKSLQNVTCKTLPCALCDPKRIAATNMNIPASPIASLQIQRNQCTANDRDSFAGHRSGVTGVIVKAAAPLLRRLCLLGAGNGNDVDLEIVAEHFDEICLVDLDEAALARCIAGLSESVAKKIVLKAGVDLSGILAELDSMQRKDSVTEAEVTAVILAARVAPLGVDLGKWDVVVSMCMISQLLDSAAMALGAAKGGALSHVLGPRHSMQAELMLAVRDGHLALLDKITSRGGSTILISDFVSSETLPEMLEVPDNKFQQLVQQAVADRNFFTGLNPAVLLDRLGRAAAERQQSVRMRGLWRWHMGGKCFAVCAMQIGPE